MRKGYVCSRYPALLIGDDIRFEGGVNSTEDENKKRKIETSLSIQGGLVSLADSENPAPIVHNAPNLASNSTKPILDVPASPAPVDTPFEQPEGEGKTGLLPPGFIPLELQPRDGRVINPAVLESDVPTSKYAALKLRLAELASLCVNRGIQLPQKPTKEWCIDQLFPPPPVVIEEGP